MSDIQKEPFIELAGGRIRCRRCQAFSKLSNEQCKRLALAGKQVCDLHGGRSTGPKTPEGRQRIADAQTVHGRETRQIREQRSASGAYMMELEDVRAGQTMNCSRQEVLVGTTCIGVGQGLGVCR